MDPAIGYIDYRLFLADEENRRSNSPAGFSRRSFLQKAGIKSPSFWKQVIDNERNLTPDTTEKFIAALGFKGKEAEYFRQAVGFAQAKTSRVKQRHYRQMLELSETTGVKLIGADTYRFYEKWYLPVLRETVPLASAPIDWKQIGKSLYPPISETEVKRGVALLEELELLRKTDSGWEQTDKTLSTGHRVASLIVRHFHGEMLQRAQESLESLSSDQRHISGITLGVSNEVYRMIEREIEALEDRIIGLVDRDPGPVTRTIQWMGALFPVARLSDYPLPPQEEKP